MLNRLSIQNYALIDSVDMSFAPGLNIITGETGAGKSIILGALSLILGQRAENRVFFDQARKCVIEGEFRIKAYALHEFFEENDLDYADDTIVRRELSPDGKSRAFVNDTPVTLSVLKTLSERLIDIHSQHATLQVGSSDFQLMILDSLSGNGEIRNSYMELLRAYRSTQTTLESLKEQHLKALAEADFKRYLFEELDAAQLVSGELKALEEERDQLEHAEEIQRALMEALHLIREKEGNIEELLHAATTGLDRASRFLPFVGEQSERLRSALIEIRDIGHELASKLDVVQLDEGRLQHVQERLSLLYNLQQKHRLSDAEDLVHLRNEIGMQLNTFSHDEGRIKELETKSQELLSALHTEAKRLHDSRKSAISTVIEGVSELLEQVGMSESRLEIQLQALPMGEFRGNGADAIEFKFSSNRGQALQSVGKVASGGELSRLMLAIKTLVASHSALPTMIFDEIDTGISGEVAMRVGDVLERMGGGMQVIAISHLPQIASKGDRHLKVYKAHEQERTRTQIKVLNSQERVLEIAQMLSGADPGEAAMDHARSLLIRSMHNSIKSS